jgi:hypothetical protein
MDLQMTDINKEARINLQLAKAREAIALTGKSPRALGIESKLKIINWIYQWGYTSSTIGQSLLNRTAGGYLQKLANQDVLVATKTSSGTPVNYFTLSPVGLELAESNTTQLFKYSEIDAFRVNQSTMRHNLIAQELTVNALATGLIATYQTERMFEIQGDKLGIKKPDIIWQTNKGMRTAVEIELSAKWDRILDDFILKIIRSLKSKEGDKHYLDRFIIFTDSAAILERYKTAMQSTSNVHTWIKNSRGHWVIENTYPVPNWLVEKVDFQLI